MSNNISTMGHLLDNNARLAALRSQLNTLTIQMGSGKKTNVFAGLGTDSIRSQRVRVELNQIDVYQTNITVGQTRIKQMLNSIAEFKEHAKSFADTLAFQEQQGDVDIESIQDAATDTLTYLRQLLNTREGDRYLFSGSDSYNQPINDTGAHGTFAQGLINAWVAGTTSTDDTIDAYKTTPETTLGYSAALSSHLVRDVTVRADVNKEIPYTELANAEGFKDILNAIGIIESLDLDKVALEDGDNPLSTRTAPGATPEEQKDNFFALFEDVIKTINAATSKLQSDENMLQRAQAQLGSISETHTTDKFTLETTLGEIEDVDPSEVAVKITALQTQLTAAYQVTALMGQLSLSAFIA